MRQARSLAFIVAAFLGLSQTAPAQTWSPLDGQAQLPVNVMAPLNDIGDWQAFHRQLETLKRNGVRAITTDIWWGRFESQGDNHFDWRYYLRYAEVVQAAGLEWIPILSFHQCGGNVGDDCNIPLPSWVWDLGPAEEMKFRDEAGFVNGEYVSFWYTGIYQQYGQAMTSFAQAFAPYSSLIKKVYLSLGPSGELRYPSYYARAGWSYPQRGRLQAYSPSAQRAFRNHARRLYGQNLPALNAAWNSQLTSFDHVSPPTDGDRFFTNGYRTIYGRDFLQWYQRTLTQHLSAMVEIARINLAPLGNVRLGAKVAGVHWLYNSPSMPHAAEYAAGYYNYAELMQSLKENNVDLTFTCLEMQDGERDRYPMYSAPRTLTEQIAGLAQHAGVPLYGENALAISNNRQAYWNVRDVLDRFPFSGFTLLRLSNIVDAWGNETDEMTPFREIVVYQRWGRQP
jgi:beta-amylase